MVKSIPKIVFKRMDDKNDEPLKVSKIIEEAASKHSKVPKVSLASSCPRNFHCKFKLKIVKRAFNRSQQINVITPSLMITVGERGNNTSGSNSSAELLFTKSN